jgi:chromosome segregation protein
LSRVEDLLFEIDKNLKTLENQAKKAERYFRLKEQYKSLSMMLASFRIISFREALTRLEDKEQQQSLSNTDISTAISNLEAVLQQQKLENLNLEKNLSIQQKASNEFIAKIRNYESDKKLKNEQLRFLEDKKNRLNDELEKDKNQLNHVFYNQKRLNEEHLQESEILEKIRDTTTSQNLEITELRTKQQKCERCKYSKIPEVLHVHHKDRNRNNNIIENLEVLCPTCHEEEHYNNKDGRWKMG